LRKNFRSVTILKYLKFGIDILFLAEILLTLALSTNQSINQPIMFIMFWGRHGRDRMGVTAYGIYASILDADGMYWLQLYVLSLSVSVAG
jgi:hypothetical protein